ncbi:hypothetical protein [Pelagicoccus albus]|uniref:Uncharacterized protein n=1 Tax=Pelagicoccus albus TaxID=415222 RepID=A0A7X1B7A1_9BACT|nr:hypothetical protein [Pelagicoccus albus]MBC2606842.1 hypothetical protein [Pelagicoccus albus]
MISAKKNNFIVEFRPTTIRAARLSSSKSPLVVEEVLEIDLEEKGDIAGEVRGFAKAKSNGFLRASCSVYPEGRIVRQVRLDSTKGKEAEFVTDYLRKSVGITPEEFSTYCLSASDGADAELSEFNKKDILVCGAPKKSISDVQSSLVHNAIYPGRLEFGTVGTLGVLKNVVDSKSDKSPVLFLEIDIQETQVVIVGAKGVEMARSIEFGSEHLVAGLKQEMNLKDEAAAEKILKSREFDLGSIAPKLLRKLLRELQSSIGFYEVQTGSSVSELYCVKGGKTLPWLENSICDLLNLKPFTIDLEKWLQREDVSFSNQSDFEKMDTTWVSLLSLIMNFDSRKANS